MAKICNSHSLLTRERMPATTSTENQRTSHSEQIEKLRGFLRSLLPGSKDIKTSLTILGMVLLGGLALFPLMSRLPVLGWDWYYFFTAHHPTDNIYSVYSPFFPYTKYIIMLFTWMDWRHSLALLGGITFMAIAIGTWRNGGRYGSILLALLTPIPLFVLWVGHPDGLALVGLLTGIIPLALIKPQITFWAFLRCRATAFWLIVCIGLTILIWPDWPSVAFGMRWNHSAATGWQAIGWPILLVGLVLILGAGNDPWRLMTAGCFITPDLMPYHLIVLLPAIGRVKGWLKLVVWLAAWMVALGLGLGGTYRYFNILFPLSIYLSLHTWEGYKQTIQSQVEFVRKTANQIGALIRYSVSRRTSS